MIDIVRELQEHAAGSPEADGDGYSDLVWQWEHGHGELDLTSPFADVTRLLQQYAAHAPATAEAPPFAVAYAIAEILDSATLRSVTSDTDTRREAFARFSWSIATAWRATLDGDIPDLAEHVRLGARARGLDAWPPVE
jgi:hypothetical protein